MKSVFENKAVESLIESAMHNLHTLAEANTIIGEPVILPNGAEIIPISKVTCGYVVGGGEYNNLEKYKKTENFPLAGGSAGGVSITPIGFMVSTSKGVEFVDIENATAAENVLKIFANIINKFMESGGKSEEK